MISTQSKSKDFTFKCSWIDTLMTMEDQYGEKFAKDLLYNLIYQESRGIIIDKKMSKFIDEVKNFNFKLLPRQQQIKQIEILRANKLTWKEISIKYDMAESTLKKIIQRNKSNLTKIRTTNNFDKFNDSDANIDDDSSTEIQPITDFSITEDDEDLDWTDEIEDTDLIPYMDNSELEKIPMYVIIKNNSNMMEKIQGFCAQLKIDFESINLDHLFRLILDEPNYNFNANPKGIADVKNIILSADFIITDFEKIAEVLRQED